MLRACSRLRLARQACAFATGAAQQPGPIPRLQYAGQQELGALQGQLEGPFILTGAMAGWAPLGWSPQELLQACGKDLPVPVEVSWDGGDYRSLFHQGQRGYFDPDPCVPLSALVKALTRAPARKRGPRPPAGPTLYLAQKSLAEALPGLAGAVPERPPFQELAHCPVQRSVWLGPAGTETPLHRDPYHNLFHQVWGRKYVRIYDPGVTPALHPFAIPPLRNTSQVSVGRDEASFPGFSALPYQECVLGPGEVLFMARGSWHYVRAESASLSVSYWW